MASLMRSPGDGEALTSPIVRAVLWSRFLVTFGAPVLVFRGGLGSAAQVPLRSGFRAFYATRSPSA